MDVHWLEPNLVDRHKVSLLCEVIIHDESQRQHCLKTALKGYHVKFVGNVPQHVTVVLLTNVRVHQNPKGMTLVAETDSHVHPRPNILLRDLQKVVEVCSGAGFMGFGLEHSGFAITLRCDHSLPMLTLAKQLHPAETIHGDVCTESLLHPICDPSVASGTLAAGVACQPYSKLGDRGHQRDLRSLTLPGVLRIGFLCRFGAMILECVMDAFQCPWFQSVLKSFADLTGYRISQGVLHLHTVWPARRSRWWGILTHPAIGRIPWRPMPAPSALPLVVDLLDQFKICTEAELQQLALDLYELGRFDAQGFEQNEIPWRGQMQTSLHSCGNQLSACPCGCRKLPIL